MQNKHVKTHKQAVKMGQRRRDKEARELVAYEASVVPTVAYIRPYSSASLPTPGGRVTARVPRWTLPLGPGADPMTLGANKVRSLSKKGKR